MALLSIDTHRALDTKAAWPLLGAASRTFVEALGKPAHAIRGRLAHNRQAHIGATPAPLARHSLVAPTRVYVAFASPRRRPRGYDGAAF